MSLSQVALRGVLREDEVMKANEIRVGIRTRRSGRIRTFADAEPAPRVRNTFAAPEAHRDSSHDEDLEADWNSVIDYFDAESYALARTARPVATPSPRPAPRQVTFPPPHCCAQRHGEGACAFASHQSKENPMSFRPYPFTEEKLQRWIAEGRGTGEGPSYIPFLMEGDVPSTHGHMERLKCCKSNRIAICFSTIELHARMYYESRARVVSIEEQFPLDRETTRRIARALGVDHPRDPKSRDIVMTTDQVVRVREPDGRVSKHPRTCKTHASIIDWNDAEHAEIERVYWVEEGLQLKLITDSVRCMPPRLIENLHAMKPHRFAPDQQTFEGEFDRQCEEFLGAIRANSDDLSLNELCTRYQTYRGLLPGVASSIALHLIHGQRLKAELAGPPLMRQGALAMAAALVDALPLKLRRAA